MADTATPRVALMSIHPEYAEKLLTGSKKAEFRRAGPKATINRILVYATRPVGALVGILEVVDVVHASPEQLWRTYGAVGGIGRKAFFAYFQGTKAGDALIVGRALRLETPLMLEAAGLTFRPPQSFRYVESTLLERLGDIPTRDRPDSSGKRPTTWFCM